MARCHLCARELTEAWATAIDIEYGSTPDRFHYMLCEDCDALSIAPLPADRLEEIYPPTYYSFASGGDLLDPDRNLVTRVKARLDRRAFTRAIALAGSPRSPQILDVGGGSGEISARLVAAVPEARATVVDFDEASIEVARERGLEGFAGRIEDFSSSDRYDLILLLNLIEHVADPRAVFARVHELLKPGGVAWIQTPNFRSLDARLFRNRSWTGLHCPRHWVVFGESGLRGELGRSDLDVIRLERAQAGSFWATSILGLRRSRGGRFAEGPVAPLIGSPAFMPLAAAGAAFDLVTRPVRRTSQLVAFVRRA